MCGRYGNVKTLEELEELTNYHAYLDKLEDERGREVQVRLPNPDIRPTNYQWVVTNERENLQALRWGLIPSYTKAIDTKYLNINARGDKLTTTWKKQLAHSRCVVPSTGYYEWQKFEGRKDKQIWGYKTEDEITWYAGLFDSWVMPSGNVIQSFTIVTTEPNQVASQVHDRMPAILNPTELETWLHASVDEALRLVKPYEGELIARPLQALGEGI